MAEGRYSQRYAIVDTAQDEELFDYIQTCAEYQCLISGNVPPNLAPALPYIVTLLPGEPLTEAWEQGRLCQNWGIAFKSNLAISDLRMHFKKFLSAKLPDGTVALFRFYDPRVLRTYLDIEHLDIVSKFYEPIDVFFNDW